MANSSIRIPKTHLIMALCLPLAVLVGYMLADPFESGSIAVLVLVLSVLAVPLILKWYHPLLVLSWNASITPVFFPGRAPLWLPLAFVALLIAIINRAANPDEKFINVPSLTRPMLLLATVVFVTGLMTGGFGLRVLGSAEEGGRKYYELLGAIIGYFALASKRVPIEKAALFTGFYFLPGMCAALANFAFAAGPGFYFLYTIFSPAAAYDQINASWSVTGGIGRLSGLCYTGPAIYLSLLALYGLRGVFDISKPWRSALFLIAVFGSFLGGFRSVLVMFCLVFSILFVLERLHKTKFLFVLIGIVALLGGFLVVFANKLPLTIQRTLSVLPLNLDPIAVDSANTTTEWRIDVWKTALTEVPRHLFRGKGYTLSQEDMEQAVHSHVSGDETTTALMVGNYHNGPLSVLIPFGIWGAISFFWFLYAGITFMYKAFKYGDPRLRTINALLLSFFCARTVFFLFVFGALESDMFIFAGLLGLSVSLNGSEPALASQTAQEHLDVDAELAEA
jgi:O-antigen ligase